MKNSSAHQSDQNDIEKKLTQEWRNSSFPGANMSREIKEQQPKFSSVKIHHPSSEMKLRDQRVMRSLPPSLKGQSRHSTPKLESAIHDLSIKSPSITLKKVRQCKWAVDNSCMKILSEEFPLERTSRFIPDGDATQVAARICECLRQRSVQATYNSQKAKAKCVAMENVKFRIQLFASENGGLMVEVQRRRGDGFAFMRECRAVLSAAEGGGEIDDEPAGLGRVANLECIKDVIKSYQPDIIRELERVDTMLADPNDDSTLHALGHLRDMTDPVKSSADIVDIVSRRVFDRSFDTCRHLLIILDSGARDTIQKSDEGNNLTIYRHQLVLNVMANAFSVLQKQDELSEICKEESIRDSVISILLDQVRVGRLYPHISVFAIQCISSLASNSDIHKLLLEKDVLSYLKEAVDFGSETHDKLGKVAANTLLQCSC